MTTTHGPPAATPFATPVADTTPMEVDATHTREEFMSRMHGKCFGCGSSAHAKKDGSHERDLCAYCKHMGHFKVVCMDKFLGHAKAQKAAMTTAQAEDGGVEINVSDVTSQKSDDVEMIASSSTTLNQLIGQQKNLVEQINAWREVDFRIGHTRKPPCGRPKVYVF
jgi:hypothetical protein